MITVQEFLLRCRVEHQSLEAWIAAGWLIPPQTEPELMFKIGRASCRERV